MADAPDIRARRRLDVLGLQIESVRREEAKAMQQIAGVASEALDAGITKAEIVKRIGISRPTLDRLLRK